MENELLQTAEPRVFAAGMNTRSTVKDATDISTYTWDNGVLYSAEMHEVGITSDGQRNMYLRLAYSFPHNARIKKAYFTLYQQSASLNDGAAPRMALYQVNESLTAGNCAQPTRNDTLIDYARMNSNCAGYTFDVTELMNRMFAESTTIVSLVLTPMDEADGCITLYGVEWNGDLEYFPKLQVEYESTYGVNTEYRTHAHEIGACGQGSIDLQCGNLMFELTDFEWGGNRMPVTIKHLYNSALSSCQYMNSDVCGSYADFSGMHIGYGWKLNVMQSIYPLMIWTGNEMIDAWKYVDENGDTTYLKENSDGKFEDADSGIVLDTSTLTLTQGEETYTFDNETLRLTSITDAYNNRMQIVYNENGQITAVKDGVDRAFTFSYGGEFLTSITAPDGSRVRYTYDGDYLKTITYPDGGNVEFVTSDSKPVDVIANSTYKMHYTFNGHRVASVTEYGKQNGAYVRGTSSAYEYDPAARRTRVTSTELADEADEQDREIYTVYTFDDDGEAVSSYVYTQDTGSVGIGGESVGIQPYMSEDGTETISHSMNLLVGHGFADPTHWSISGSCDNSMAVSFETDDRIAKYGTRYVKASSSDGNNMETGIYQTTAVLPAGDYTFSAYVTVPKGIDSPEELSDYCGAYLRVITHDYEILGQSEYIATHDADNIRLIVPFTLETAQSVNMCLLLGGRGEVYFSAPQLERNPYATAYNLLENGNFEHSNAWLLHNARYECDGSFDMSHLMTVVGDLDDECYACQDVAVDTRRSARETFTLSGWAKGNGLPDHEREELPAPSFRLRAEIHYADAEDGAEPETYTADFSPCTEDWQYASVQFAKNEYRTVDKIRVYCDYGYNVGEAYFDAVQLTCGEQEYDLTAVDFVTEPDDEEPVTTPVTDTPDDEPDEFTERMDEFGNTLTETTFADGQYGTIYRHREYGANGNDLVQDVDPRFYYTNYTVDEETSRVRTVTDRCGAQTEYEYDAAGRVIDVYAKDCGGTTMARSVYDYDAFGNLTHIGLGHGLSYCLNYNAYHKLESIGIDQKDEDLITYEYKNGNGRLKSMTYANGNVMKATYNTLGQMVAETWYETAQSTTPMARYKYTYNAEGELVRSIDITAKKEYTYTYENGLLLRVAEYAVILGANEIIGSRTLICTITYTYKEQTPVRKRITWADGAEHTVFYTQSEDSGDTVKFRLPYGTEENPDAQRTVIAHSGTDKLGRKVFDELQIGSGFLSRKFSYLDGEPSWMYWMENKLKSAPTTTLVSKIEFADGGGWLSYQYDGEERITEVGTPSNGTTYYTYDDFGQLLTETHVHRGTETVINTMTYDNYGNILSKNGVEYTYADGGWRDLLLTVGDQTISYDAQGNPLDYLGHVLTWEKGRQLKSYDANTYTYNANGIRTSKTIGEIRHEYTLDGAKILRETWDGNSLIPLYDNEDSVCGILYNNEPYYFLKNLQGDIITVTDRNGNTVASYQYDAWGVCTTTNYRGNVGDINPFRYRGYYYDAEIGLYYLQSRYYDPEIGRFINADEPEIAKMQQGPLKHNLFAYCENDPVNRMDFDGKLIATTIIKCVLGALFGLLVQLISDLVEYAVKKYVLHKTVANQFSPTSPLGDYLGSAVTWALSSLSPVSKAAKVILPMIPVGAKHITNAFCGRFKFRDFLVDLAYALVTAIVSVALTKTAAKQIESLRKYRKKNSRNLQLKATKKAIRYTLNLRITKVSISLTSLDTITILLLNLLCS